MAICAPLFIAGASDSKGPVKPREIPIFMSSAITGEASINIAAETPIIFFIFVSHLNTSFYIIIDSVILQKAPIQKIPMNLAKRKGNLIQSRY